MCNRGRTKRGMCARFQPPVIDAVCRFNICCQNRNILSCKSVYWTVARFSALLIPQQSFHVDAAVSHFVEGILRQRSSNHSSEVIQLVTKKTRYSRYSKAFIHSTITVFLYCTQYSVVQYHPQTSAPTMRVEMWFKKYAEYIKVVVFLFSLHSLGLCTQWWVLG